MQENETLLDLVILDGKLFKKVLKAGEESLVPVEEKKPLTGRFFEDTDTYPQEWDPQTANALTPPSDPLTREELVNRSMRVEALLIKALSPRMKRGDTESFDTGGNGALKELLQDLCRVMGGPWLDYVERIK